MQVSVTPRVHEERLPELQAVSLFRVAQEALRNAERHAGASRVDIVLEERDDQVVLRITDDGQGFDVRHVELSKDRGIGLTNMRERVERNGGTFKMVSCKGHTSVTASFPLGGLA